MTRYKWIGIHGITNFDGLIKAINREKFSDHADFGFDVQQQIDRCLSADCITRVIETRRIYGPFGDTELMRFDNYERVRFAILQRSDGEALLRIESPPRSLANVIRALESAAAQKIYLSQISLPFDFIREALSGLLFRMVSAELGDVIFGQKMIGRAQITATEGNTLSDFGLLAKAPYRLEGFRAVVISNTESAALAVSRSNVLTLRGALSRAVLERVEASLRRNQTS